jgi:hypothetical protein
MVIQDSIIDSSATIESTEMTTSTEMNNLIPEDPTPVVKTEKAEVKAKVADSDDEDLIEDDEKPMDRFGSDGDLDDATLAALQSATPLTEEEEEFNFDAVKNILDLPENEFPKFTLAKNKARFLRMVTWYRQKEEWIEVAPLSGVTKLFKQQSKELEGIRSNKMDYEMELETGTLTPSQRSYRKDELKMCRVQEKMAVHLISKLQLKIKSGRR